MAFSSALLVIFVNVVAPPVAQAQTTTAPDRAHFDPAPCPTPNLPGYPQVDLGPNFSCGYLTVPVDHAHPDGPTLRIPVARVKAVSPDPKPDPIVYLAGGPGGSGLVAAAAVVANGVNADRDIIFIDQRSTLHADPFLNCPEIDAFNIASIGLAPTAARTKAAHLAATNACHARLESSRYNLADFDTRQNAADIADLRVALGIKSWNVYGVSYGTFLAQTLLRDYPTGIRSVVLDGVAPVQGNLLNAFWPDAAAGYAAVFKACAAQPACKAAYPNLRSELVDVVKALDRHPMTVTVPAAEGISRLDPLHVSPDNRVRVVLDGYQVANLFVLLSNGGGRDLVAMPAILNGLAHRDGTLAATALQQVIVGTPSGVTGYPLSLGVFCREQTPFTSPETVLKTAQRALPGFPASTLRLPPQLPQPFGDCQIWNVGKANPKTHKMVRSSVPVLLLTGTFDSITAPREAKIAARGLSNAHIVEIAGVGHNTVSHSTCAAEVMVDFLRNPGPHSNTSCVATLKPPSFQVP